MLSFRRSLHDGRAGARAWLAMLLLALLTTAPSAPSALAQQSANVGPEVLATLRAGRSAAVVVALAAPASLAGGRLDLAKARAEIADAQAAVLATVDASEFQLRERFSAIPALAGSVHDERGLAKLASHPAVVRIDLDTGGAGHLANSVPLLGANRWHASGIRGAGVVVAVLDTGIDSAHSDLGDAPIAQACFLDNDGTIGNAGLCPNGADRQQGAGAAEDTAGHGTHVSGIIASNGTISAPGMAPDASIVSVKVLDSSSFAGSFYYVTEIIAALDFLIASRPDVQVINMSLGTNQLFTGDCDSATAYTIAGATAIDTLRARGTIAFASAGNNGSSTQMSWPACLRNVISVGATNNSDVVASFSNSNASTDIMAPGVGIVSDGLGGVTTTASGTSMAAPHAAGCAALLIQSGTAITPDQIEARMEASPVRVLDPDNGRSFPRLSCAPTGPGAVDLAGPTSGYLGFPATFTATTTPITATLPLGYSWSATDLLAASHTAALSDSLTLTWQTPGAKTVVVSVSNGAGTVTDTLQIDIIDHSVRLPLVTR